MEQAEFEQMIKDAIAMVPERIRSAMQNVAFVVESSRRPLNKEVPIERGHVLLGLYQGIPLTARGSNYQWVLPDKITIFQDVIEELGAGDVKRIQTIVTDTVHHEIAHHLGMDEAMVRTWERKRKKIRTS